MNSANYRQIVEAGRAQNEVYRTPLNDEERYSTVFVVSVVIAVCALSIVSTH